MSLNNNETLYSELLAETKSTIDNLLIDPRAIDRVITTDEKLDDSVIARLTDFVKEYSNSRVSITPTLNLTENSPDQHKVFGLKLKIKF